MNSYPAEQSVLVLDNARIHYDQDFIEYIESFGGRVEFLPHTLPTLILLKPVFLL
jgi:transposase